MSTNKSITELFHGKDFADKSELFKTELNKLEEIHIDYFKSRPAILQSQKHDKISNHVSTYFDGRTISLLIPTKTLPENIKSEINSLFSQIWEIK